MRRWRAAPSSCAIVQGLRQLTGSASSSAAPHPWTFDADTAITGLGQHAYRGHVTDRCTHYPLLRVRLLDTNRQD